MFYETEIIEPQLTDRSRSGTFRPHPITDRDVNVEQAQAESIAIAALGFIAGDEKLLPRFLSLTGIEAAQVRDAAREPGFMAGVLQFILAHEPTLLAFSQQSGIAPQDVARARAALPLGDDGYEGSA